MISFFDECSLVAVACFHSLPLILLCSDGAAPLLLVHIVTLEWEVAFVFRQRLDATTYQASPSEKKRKKKRRRLEIRKDVILV